MNTRLYTSEHTPQKTLNNPTPVQQMRWGLHSLAMSCLLSN